ncbi:MAG: hypothetical protein JJ895_13435 [Balneolaceae bacterium]|nr:hypothetical protein [Balneolaceae bacterium]
MAEVSEDKRRCFKCNSVENEIRIIGGYIVELAEIEYKGSAKLACQGCKRKIQTEQKYKRDESKKGFLSKLGFKK